MNIIFFLIIASLFFSLVTLEIMIFRRWRGAFRLLGLLPAAALFIVILNIIIGVQIDPTSHNLWPFEITTWSGIGLVYVGALLIIRKIVTSKNKQK